MQYFLMLGHKKSKISVPFQYEPIQNMNTSLQVVNLMISNITPYVEMISNYGEHLLRLISQRKKLLEVNF